MRERTALAAPLLLVLAIASGCAIVNRIDGMAQARDLAAHGEAATARILRVWDTGITVNNDPVAGMLLEVHPSGRDAYQAQTKCLVPRLQVPQIQPGNEVAVMFDPADPARVSLAYLK